MFRPKSVLKLLVVSLAALSAASTMASTLSYSAAGMPQTYGSGTACGSPLTGTINVPVSLTVSDLDIRFRTSHTWRTDTNLTLTSPDGTVVDLLTGNYGTNLDNYNITFDDDAADVVDTGAHAVNQASTGPGVAVRSESDPLSDFNGEDALGNWTYSICDVYLPADNGSVLEIGLIFEVFPNINADKSVDTYVSGGFATPGSDVIYTFSVSNSGLGSADDNSIVIIDSVPPDLEFYNGDMDDGGGLTTTPMAFTQSASGLTFTYATDAKYSNLAARPANMAACTYTPISGYDPAVKHICVNPQGEFLAGDPDPSFTVSFRARIK